MLNYVPVATLTALAVSGLAVRPEEAAPRLSAALVAGFVVYLTGRIWLCIVAGLGLYWLLRLI